MKKYSPSIKNNNELKEQVLKELKVLIYKLENGKVNSYLDKADVKEVANQLKDSCESFENSVGTGKEDIYDISTKAMKSIKALDKQSNQDLFTRFEEAADDVTYNIDLYKSVLDGSTDVSNLEKEKEAKVSWQTKKLKGRLSELSEIKEQFLANEKRLEDEILGLEKDLHELDESMVKEENERRINELYRKISSFKSKLDMLNVRKANYSACFNLLDLIYANANEIVVESDYSVEDMGKAKALLNLGRLRAVLSEPEKAIAILKRMEKDTQEISERTKNMDNKVFAMNTATATVSQDALAYKEELLRKKREKELIAENKKDLDNVVSPEKGAEVTKVEGDK